MVYEATVFIVKGRRRYLASWKRPGFGQGFCSEHNESMQRGLKEGL